MRVLIFGLRAMSARSTWLSFVCPLLAVERPEQRLIGSSRLEWLADRSKTENWPAAGAAA